MKKYIIILGPPGSGKGTQAKNISEKYGYYLFGTGNLMRQEAQKNTELGKKFKKVWDKGEGELVSEDLVLELVKKEFNKLSQDQKIIFDGYPRRIVQAKYLDQILQSNDLKVLNLNVDSDELINRMSTRRICTNCKTIYEKPVEKGIKECEKCGGQLIQRDEDKPEIIKKRLDVYNFETLPLLEYYNKSGLVLNIDGNPPINEVWETIQEKIEND